MVKKKLSKHLNGLAMLRLADYFFTFFHLAIVLFNLFGWIPKKTRKGHFILVALTAASWFVVGIWYGIGYCPITDWQWQIKGQLGEQNLPDNFIEYIAEKIMKRDVDSELVNLVIGICFILAAMASVFVNFILPHRKKRRVRRGLVNHDKVV